MDALQQFYENVGMRETVKQFFIDELKKKAIDGVLNKQSTAGIYEANRAIEAGFLELERMFQKNKKRAVDTAR